MDCGLFEYPRIQQLTDDDTFLLEISSIRYIRFDSKGKALSNKGSRSY